MPNYADIPITIINGAYGLKVTTNDGLKIVNKETGQTLNGDNEIEVVIEYESELDDPNIMVVLERRSYETVYAKEYEAVYLQDYVKELLTYGRNLYEYFVTDNPNEVPNVNIFTITLDEGLTTGTYRLVFRLYDDETYIGEAYEYIIIK